MGKKKHTFVQPDLFPEEVKKDTSPKCPEQLLLTFKDHPQVFVSMDVDGKYLRLVLNMSQVTIPAKALGKLKQFIQEAGEYYESLGD